MFNKYFNCPTCRRELYLHEDTKEESLKMRCEHCDPSTERDKYFWCDLLQFWGYAYSIFPCPKCEREVQVHIERKDELEYACEHCDPSTPAVKYEWNKKYKQWVSKYYYYTCLQCNSQIQSNIPLEEHDLPWACKYCDPSTESMKYEWNEDNESWDLAYLCLECHLCGKNIKVIHYPRIKIDLNYYTYEPTKIWEVEVVHEGTGKVQRSLKDYSWPPGDQEHVHGYNCHPDKDIIADCFQEVVVYRGKEKTKFYRRM